MHRPCGELRQRLSGIDPASVPPARNRRRYRSWRLRSAEPGAQQQWIRGITVTTGLVDAYSTPTLLRLMASHHLDVRRFVTHHFALDQFAEAYDVFARAADTGALKVVLSRVVWAPCG
ncbi:MAG: hypothetical protein ACM3ML_37905 [Micromonosporaceae bacterium]